MFKKTLSALVITATMAGAANAQKIAVVKGQKLETTASTKTVMEVMGQNMDMQNTATSAIEVKDVTDNGFLFANTLKRMVINSTIMGNDVNFDSDKKEDMDGQVGQSMKDKIGKTDEVTVDKQGKVIEIRGSTEQAAGGMNDMMNMSNMLAKGQPYPILIQLPGRAVKLGDSWTDSSGTPATIKTVTTYTLKQIDGGAIFVTFAGTLVKNGTIEQQGMEIQMDITGDVKGDATYDASTGLLKNNNTVSDIKGTLGVMGQNAPLTMKVTVSTVAKKL